MIIVALWCIVALLGIRKEDEGMARNRQYVIGARWVVTAPTGAAAQQVIANMLRDLLGESVGEFGYLGTYESADSPEEAKRQARAGNAT